MKKVLLLLCFVGSIAADVSGLTYVHNPGNPNILHLSLHTGCIKDFEDVAKELQLNLTSWNIGAMQPRTNFDGTTNNNAIWNITAQRAQAVWERHEDFFNQFDVILTSDIAPLSRIFLQNDWQKPLIIWICNRFDYADHGTNREGFPDRAYYQMFQEAVSKPNVRIIPYTDYEWYHAEQRGLSIGRRTIRPIGSIDDSLRSGDTSFIPDYVDPAETLFIYPRLNDQQMRFAQSVCADLSIKTYTGVYNGPGELARYKAVLYFPYAWSNLALYENLQRGIIHFVPSIAFVKVLLAQRKPIRTYTHTLFELGEWYKPEYKDVIIYFDSWQDLKVKFETLDYQAMQQKIKAFGAKHREYVLNQWQQVFDELL